MLPSAKPKIFPAIAILIIALLPVPSVGPTLQAAEASASPQAVLGVDDFMKNADRYPGKVGLEGVVSGVAPDRAAISLIDSGEFQACGVTTCAQLTLPVHWSGPLPAVGDRVKIDGQTREVKGKLMFVAERLEKVARP
ncbi:MAG: hypothetical protein C4567_00830 [Deltaproteobacteria bacterium]|nr:MAG: hypothetical protein C4567_00830 [Deltaproteobacteria bacterium]